MYEHFCKAWDSFKHYLLNKRQRKPEGQSRMKCLEKTRRAIKKEQSRENQKGNQE
jgi:hypothetical protein